MTSDNYKPLISETWQDFESVVGCYQGANGGCWCTWWRLPRSEWEKMGRIARKNYFRQVVERGSPTGIIAFENNVPCGWCAIAPSSDYPVINRSPVIKPSLQQDDWYVSCFFVKAKYRRSGIMKMLLKYAIDFAKNNAAKAIEACPRDNLSGSGTSDIFVGKTSVFIENGFKEIHRLRYDRPLLRLDLL